MAIYEYNGQRYELPDDLDPNKALERIQQSGGTDSPETKVGASAPATPSAGVLPSSSFNPGPTPEKIDPATLASNRDWVAAAAIRWKAAHPGQPLPSPQDLAEFGLDEMGWFNYNTPMMAVDAAQLRRASQEEKKAFLYLMDTYDKLEMSWAGAGRFIKGAALDPLNYVGLSTLGLGIAGGQATKLASKEALKQMLRSGIQTGIEGAIQAGVQDSIRQSVEIDAGRQKEFDYGRLAKEAGVGAAAGAVLGGVADGAGTLLRKAPKDAAPVLPGLAKDAATVAKDGEKAVSGTTLAGDAAKAVPEASRAAEAPPVTASVARAPEGAYGMPRPDGNVPAENPIIRAIKDVTENNGMRFVPDRDRIGPADHPIQAILDMKPEDARPLIEEVRRAALTGNEGDTLLASVSQATEKLMKQYVELARQLQDTTATTAKSVLQKQFDDLNKVLNVVRSLDLDSSSMQGAAFAGRNGLINTGAMRELSPESILAQKGIDPMRATPEQLADARNQFAEKLAQRVELAEKQPEVLAKMSEVEDALAAGDIAKATALHQELSELKAHVANLKADDGSAGKPVWQNMNRVIKGINEYVISTVFTTKTVIVNLVPSLTKMIYRPALDALMRGPFDSVSWRMAAAQYMTYATHIDTAFKSAMAAFKYEKGLLSHDFVNYLENEPMLKKMYGGGVLRIFPRILNASDELFSQLAYRSYIASEATGWAYKEGARIGYTGAKLDDFVKQTVAEHINKAFEPQVGVGALDMLRADGISRGLKGDKLTEWMKLQMDKNADLFRSATNQSGLNYANDLLFKREFSGEGGASYLAREYEKIVNKAPILRLMGQLFFRTPVRVFEEGFRLTPGLNIISGAVAGQFLKDLRGANGVPAQVRAQGEAMLSMALGAMVMNMYAQGKITGGGPDNWKERRTLEDGKKWSPYTMKVGEHEFNFRNLDPFSTPLKIMVNVLQRLDTLEYRKAQGEYMNANEYQKTAATISVAWLSVVKAVQDANLTDGITQLVQLGTDLADPEAKEMALVKWLGQKAQLMVPNQWNKAKQVELDNPLMNDPATITQFLRSRLNPNDSLVPKRYDALGKPVEVENPWAGITGFDVQLSKKEFTKAEQVKQELGKLAVNGERTFNAPYTVDYVPLWKGQDLRTLPSADGKSTIYDRWQEYIAKTRMTDTLYKVLVQNQHGSMGTKSNPGMREQMASEIINEFRKQAFMQMFRDEMGGYQKLIQSQIEAERQKAGLRDVKSFPFQ